MLRKEKKTRDENKNEEKLKVETNACERNCAKRISPLKLLSFHLAAVSLRRASSFITFTYSV